MENDPFDVMSVSASALAAERLRMNVAAVNLANANVLKTPEGGPYQRKRVVFESLVDSGADFGDGVKAGGVAAKIDVDKTPGETRYEPGHPHADASGNVRLSNVNTMFEMVDLMTASRSYEANLAAIRVYRELMQRTIQMGR
jgi:flagellar basal-body rod protein FlgC